MSADLSRRLAKVISVLSLMGLGVKEKRALADRAEQAQDFSDLPEPDKRAILAAEKIARSGLSMAEILNLKETINPFSQNQTEIFSS